MIANVIKVTFISIRGVARAENPGWVFNISSLLYSPNNQFISYGREISFSVQERA